MARLGSTNTANRLLRASAVVTGAPCTFACWYKGVTLPSTDADNGHNILAVTDTGSNDNFFALSARVSDDLFRLTINDGVGQVDAASTTVAVAGTWFHLCGVAASATDRRIYVDGVDEGQETTSRTPTGLDTTSMFVTQISAGFFSPANAALAEGGIWNVALTAGEARELASGVSPNRVRPLSLKGYYQLPANNTGAGIDYSGNGNGLTEAGTIGVADHAPVGPMWGLNQEWKGAFTGLFFTRRYYDELLAGGL